MYIRIFIYKSINLNMSNWIRTWTALYRHLQWLFCVIWGFFSLWYLLWFLRGWLHTLEIKDWLFFGPSHTLPITRHEMLVAASLSVSVRTTLAVFLLLSLCTKCTLHCVHCMHKVHHTHWRVYPMFTALQFQGLVAIGFSNEAQTDLVTK